MSWEIKPPEKVMTAWKKYRKYMTLVIAVIGIIFATKPAFGSRCLICADYNRRGDSTCIENHKECGECKEGFIADADDPRMCFQLSIQVSPSNINEPIGKSVQLPCKFNTRVNCFWTKNGRQVEVNKDSRYNYNNKDAKQNIKTMDCSLHIRIVTEDDVGQWTCGSLATSETNSFQSKPISISVYKPQTTNHKNKDSSTELFSMIFSTEIPATHDGREEHTQNNEDTKIVLNNSTNYNTGSNTNPTLSALMSILIILLILFFIIVIIVAVVLWYRYQPKKKEKKPKGEGHEIVIMLDKKGKKSDEDKRVVDIENG